MSGTFSFSFFRHRDQGVHRSVIAYDPALPGDALERRSANGKPRQSPALTAQITTDRSSYECLRLMSDGWTKIGRKGRAERDQQAAGKHLCLPTLTPIVQ